MADTKPVLISGGGLASLLLGQSLLRSNIPFQIFERDVSFVFRAQGYRLRLSAEGLDAVESVLSPELWELFWSKSGKTGGAGMSVLDALTGEKLQENLTVGSGLSSRGGKVIGMARGDMRQIFAKGLEKHIQWNKKVAGYELTDDGVHAIFEDGSKSEEGSLLVAGDGIYSKIAKQVSGGQLKTYDTGARGIHGQAPTSAFKNLGEGVFSIRGKGASIITNVRPGELEDDSLEFGWTMTAPPGVINAPNDNYSIVGEAAASIAKDLTRDWNPRFKPLVDQMRVEDAAFWKITCSTPSGVPEWPNVPRVTVIGDAAHSMTPAGGLGANTALRDSALLGRLLGEASGFREGLTAEFEKQMRVYGSEAVGQSYGLATKQFGIQIEEGKTKLAW
ncbi:hypothetical protein PWT90_05025 [Aphanocladium album]|nr:hypothetical protein PWT90_05025 [Aphanocladium album]